MTTPFPSSPGGGELSRWVSQIKAQHSGTQKPLSPVRTGNSQTADELEEEIKQSRLNRQRRRSRLSGAGVRGIDTTSPNPNSHVVGASADSATPQTPSSEELNSRIFGPSRSRVTTPVTEQDPTMTSKSSYSPPKHSALLDRYGGQAGPTGVTKPGSAGANVSLASFMGGKASGPRMGKLVGDGRSAPPEAEMIDDSQRRERRALPGMIQEVSSPSAFQPAASPLASFLEARASGKTVTSQPKSSPSPEKTTFSPPASNPPFRGASASASPIESPTFASSPSISGLKWPPLSNKHELSFADRGLPTAKRSDSRSRPSSPTKTAQPQGHRNSVSTYTEEKKRVEANTSPFKENQTPSSRPLSPIRKDSDGFALPHTITSKTHEQEELKADTAQSAKLAPASIVHSPTSDALASSRFPSLEGETKPTSPGASPTFAATQQPLSDKLPTASLSRLRAKNMVGQRVREAQDRAAAASETSSPITRSSSRSNSLASPVLKEGWTGEHNAEGSSSAERKPWHPGKLGSALPGMTDQGRSRSSSKVESPSPTVAEDYAPPVRLPGLGGTASPFTSRQSPYKEEKEPLDNGGVPLEHPTKVRARGPKRTSARTASATRGSQEAQQEHQTGSVTGSQVGSERFKTAQATFCNRGGVIVDSDTVRARALGTALSPLADDVPSSSFHQPIPPTQDPSVSRLIGSEQDTFPSIKPSVRQQTSPRPTVQDIEETFKTDESEVTRPRIDTNVGRPEKQVSLDSADKRLNEGAGALEALVAGEKVQTPIVPTKPLLSHSKSNAYSPRAKVTIPPPKKTNKADISAVLRSTFEPKSTLGRPKTISVDVLNLRADGSTQALADHEAHILYESETQVITHRFKDNETGLVANDIFVRAGKHSATLGGPSSPEASKIQELAKRFNTKPIDARQGRECEAFVELLGGVVVTREGARNRFEASNTHLYCVRGVERAIYVDQVDLLTSSLCSAYSFVVSIMSDVFVWHGLGSSHVQRSSATKYGRSLRGDKSSTSTLTEYQEGMEDELFWACFDPDVEYASAFHHRLLHSLAEEADRQPKLFSLVVDGDGERAIVPTPSTPKATFSSVDLRPDSIYVLSLPFEVYVLVGALARSDKSGTSAALDAASALARSVHERRGKGAMVLPVHAIVLPSIIPKEVKAAFRYWDDAPVRMSKRGRGKHLAMNLYTEREAREVLRRNEFERREVWEEDFLPIGVSPEDVGITGTEDGGKEV